MMTTHFSIKQAVLTWNIEIIMKIKSSDFVLS